MNYYVYFQYSKGFIQTDDFFPFARYDAQFILKFETNSSGKVILHQCIWLQLHVILLVVLNITLEGPYLYKTFLLKHPSLVLFFLLEHCQINF